MTQSALYLGHVAHNRPGKHRLRYRVFMLALDLDELPGLSLRTLKHNRPARLAIFDRDHAGRIDAPIKPQIETKLREAGIRWIGGRIVMLTMPRMLGYVFNPLTVYFCFGRDGALAAIAHEVSNTFGESHFYVLPPRPTSDGRVAQACDKNFFVSPFLEMDLHYAFEIRPPGDAVSVAMRVMRGHEIALTASFAGEHRALTDANLLRAWAGNPLMTVGAMAAIHWEALKMWLKGVRYLGRGTPAARTHPKTAA